MNKELTMFEKYIKPSARKIPMCLTNDQTKRINRKIDIEKSYVLLHHSCPPDIYIQNDKPCFKPACLIYADEKPSIYTNVANLSFHKLDGTPKDLSEGCESCGGVYPVHADSMIKYKDWILRKQ